MLRVPLGCSSADLASESSRGGRLSIEPGRDSFQPARENSVVGGGLEKDGHSLSQG